MDKSTKKEYLEKQKRSYFKISVHLRTASAKRKFITLEKLLSLINKKKLTIVAASGTFSLPHFGHSDYLEQAKKYGDKLVVCLNSDISIKTNRRCPLFVPDYGRVVDIASREAVDYILMFDEQTPVKIISYLKPDIYVKGDDWSGHPIPEVVSSPATKVIFVKRRYKFSSSQLVDNVIKFDKRIKGHLICLK